MRRPFQFFSAALDNIGWMVLLAVALAWSTRAYTHPAHLVDFITIRITLVQAVVAVVFVSLCKTFWNSLDIDREHVGSTSSLILRVTLRSILLSAALLSYLRIHQTFTSTVPVVERFFLVTLSYGSLIAALHYRHRFDYGEPARVLILGTGRRAIKAWREVRTRHFNSKQVLGFIDDRRPDGLPTEVATMYLGSVANLQEYLLRNVVDELVIATPMRSCYDLTQQAVAVAEAAGVKVIHLNDLFNSTRHGACRRSESLIPDAVPINGIAEWEGFVKRLLDVVVSSVGIIALSPMFLLIGICVKLSSPGPVFFVQDRYGYGRRRFRMYKFRSMVHDAPQLMPQLESKNEASGPIFKMEKDPRVTRLGGLLRSTSLDELPQLWNVLKGEMSLVGPRPMSVRDVMLFSEVELMRRFSVRPGITGIWQVSGRSLLTFEQWIALDFAYIDEWSLGLDLKILARTVPVVLKRYGAV